MDDFFRDFDDDFSTFRLPADDLPPIDDLDDEFDQLRRKSLRIESESSSMNDYIEDDYIEDDFIIEDDNEPTSSTLSNSRVRTRVLILLVFSLVYAIVVISYISLIYQNALSGLISIYITSIVFALGSKFKLFSDALRSRFRDDLFLMLVPLNSWAVIQVIQNSFSNIPFSPTTLSSIMAPWLWKLNLKAASVLFVSLKESAFVEYHIVTAILLLIVLSQNEVDKPSQKILDGLLLFALDILAAIMIAYAMSRILATFYLYIESIALFVNVIVNLIIAFLGVTILMLARGYRRVD